MQITIERMHCPQCTERTVFEVLRYRHGELNNRTTLRCVGCGHVFGIAAAQRQWVGLTEEDLDYLCHLAYTGDEEFALTVQALLKGKNT